MSAEAIDIGNATTTFVARTNVSYRRRFAMTASGRSATFKSERAWFDRRRSQNVFRQPIEPNAPVADTI